MKRVFRNILHTRIQKLTVELDESIYRAKQDSDMWNTLTKMKSMLNEEYSQFKKDYSD